MSEEFDMPCEYGRGNIPFDEQISVSQKGLENFRFT